MGASSRSCKYVLNTLMQVNCHILFFSFFALIIVNSLSRVSNIVKLFLCLQTFQNKKLAHAVNQRTLDNLITELLLWLLDERVPRMDDGSQLLKALNVLMLKILVNLWPFSQFMHIFNIFMLCYLLLTCLISNSG